MTKKVLVFINPASRQGARGIEEALAWLNTNGFEILNDVDAPAENDIMKVVARFESERPVVIVGGGDGSVNHALPSLLKTGLPLLLLPLGTANNLARTLAVPTTIPEALSLLITGGVKRLDVGIVRPAKSKAVAANTSPRLSTELQEGDIPFMNVVGIGMSARVNRFVPSHYKRVLGVFAFAITALRVAARMTPFHITVTTDGRKFRGNSWQVTVCNGRNYGSGLTIDENATLNDATLHGISTHVGKWWHGFGLIPSLKAGRFHTRPEIKTFSGHEVRIVTRRSKHVDIDGDLKARTPIDIFVRTAALRMYVPKTEKLSSATESR